jgi:hypothetical protein
MLAPATLALWWLLAPSRAAKSLAVMLLKKMDNCFYSQRRAMEDGFSLPHGTFCGV